MSVKIMEYANRVEVIEQLARRKRSVLVPQLKCASESPRLERFRRVFDLSGQVGIAPPSHSGFTDHKPQCYCLIAGRNIPQVAQKAVGTVLPGIQLEGKPLSVTITDNKGQTVVLPLTVSERSVAWRADRGTPMETLFVGLGMLGLAVVVDEDGTAEQVLNLQNTTIIRNTQRYATHRDLLIAMGALPDMTRISQAAPSWRQSLAL